MIFFKLSDYNGGIMRVSAISGSSRENMRSPSSNDSNPCSRALVVLAMISQSQLNM